MKVFGVRSSWAKDQIVYFVAEFSKPFISSDFDLNQMLLLMIKVETSPDRLKIKAAFQFQTSKNEPILVKVGISAVSVENARQNLKAEIPHWNFEKVRQDAKNAWNKELSQIEVTDDNQDNLTKFYTALYHTKIQPNIFQDVNGDYRGLDGKTHNAPKVYELHDFFALGHFPRRASALHDY